MQHTKLAMIDEQNISFREQQRFCITENPLQQWKIYISEKIVGTYRFFTSICAELCLT